MCLTVTLVRAKVQTILVLTQVVGNIDVPHQWHLVTFFLGPGFQFGNRLGQEILVRHDNHRDSAAAKGFEHLANPLGIVTGTVDDILTTNVALFSFDDPFIAITVHTRDRTEAFDMTTGLTGTLGQGLSQLSRVNITIQRIPHTTGKVVGLKEGMQILHLGRGHDVHLQPDGSGLASDLFKLLHTLFGMGQTQAACNMVVHRIVHIFGQPAVHIQTIALHVHDRPVGGKVRTVASSVPCGSSGQLILFEQDTISPARARQMEQG